VFYAILKLYARLAIKIYCRKIVINKPHLLQSKGPLLLAANHPNSFLDGIIITTLFENKVYSLARGDAFRNKKAARILKRLHLLPVYRSSEGAENLDQNYTTFSACRDVFLKKEIVLIFSEGYCKNEWHLRPLRKGTARLAISSWEKGIDLTVLPVAFNYSSFRTFGKNLHLHFGKPLDKDQITEQQTEGKQMLAFNRQLHHQLQELVYEIDPQDDEKQKRLLHAPQSLLKKLLLAIPASAGWLLHLLLYYPVRRITRLKFNNEFYDAVLISLLFLAYPFYLLLIGLILLFTMGWPAALLSILLLPFCAWACVQLKDQFD
jgi:1-acyl-sn-glycerol-3-phosphate acyltransferase